MISIPTSLHKYSGIGFRNLLWKFFTMCLTHNFIPDRMFLGEIRPKPKNNIASKTTSDSYWPAMRSSNLFKVFEHLLLLRFQSILNLHSCQFGSLKKLSRVTENSNPKWVVQWST